MLDADKALTLALMKLGGSYLRYSDDILLIVEHDKEKRASELVEHTLKKLKLAMNPDKLERTEFYYVNGRLTCKRPLTYLGISFDGEKILLKAQTLSRYYRKMKQAIAAIRVRNRNVNGQFQTPKRRLYRNYSHLGHRNFVSYAMRAHRAAGSRSGIAHQIRKHSEILKRMIDRLEYF